MEEYVVAEAAFGEVAWAVAHDCIEESLGLDCCLLQRVGGLAE